MTIIFNYWQWNSSPRGERASQMGHKIGRLRAITALFENCHQGRDREHVRRQVPYNTETCQPTESSGGQKSSRSPGKKRQPAVQTLLRQTSLCTSDGRLLGSINLTVMIAFLVFVDGQYYFLIVGRNNVSLCEMSANNHYFCEQLKVLPWSVRSDKRQNKLWRQRVRYHLRPFP